MAFPTPEPGHISPNSLDSAPLDLATTTVIRDTSLEAGSLPVVEGTAIRSEEEVGSPTTVLVLEYVGGEEGDSIVCCQNSCRGKCSFCGANSQVCLTNGNCHIKCGALLHECECASPTLVTPLPDILRYLPSTLEGTCRVGEEPCTRNAATQTLEAVMTRGRGVEDARCTMGEGWADSRAEGAAEGKQSSCTSKGGVALTPSPLLPQWVPRQRSPQLPECSSEPPRQPHPH